MIAPIPAVLAATDFSDRAAEVVRRAYSIVDDGGTVHLLHVLEVTEPILRPNPLYAHYVPGRAPTAEQRERQHAELARRLRGLVPAEAGARAIRTEVHVVEADDAAEAIVDAAERVDADVACVGSHGQTGFVGALLGSVAKKVVDRSRRPVLLVPLRESA